MGEGFIGVEWGITSDIELAIKRLI